MQVLELQTLGGMQIALGGRSLMGQLSAKAQALLCYLAVTGRPHSRLALAGLLWGEKSEAAALTNLRQALSSLRRVLSSHLNITRHSVAFERTAPYRLDTESFVRLCRAGQGDISTLREAMEVYRGDFLTGFYVQGATAFEEWVVVERERLRTLALEALHVLVTHHAYEGDYATALRYATRLLTMVPWHEEVHRLKMLLLARSGRHAEALAQYEECRRVLAQELGVEPAVETRALYERIRTARHMRRSNLPSQPTPFVGRESELAEISHLLADPACRLLTLTGPGGIGKTRLAIRAAEQVGVRFLNGVCFVPLAAVPSADLMVTMIADRLGLALRGRDPQSQVLDYLREKEMLLVLDGLEHLLDGAPLLSAMLEAAPDIKLLVTSRERLRSRWESLFEVKGLEVPPEGRVADPLEHDAVRLFVRLARRASPGFEPERELNSIVRVCRLVEGMPLGIELAAAWVGRRSCADIAQELERGLDLSTPLRDVPRRHSSLRTAFEYSWRLLAEEERLAFSRLSVFRGGFSQEAAAQVSGASTRALAALVDKSLLRREASERYAMHELLRQYAAEKLGAMPDEVERVRDRHCAYYISFLSRYEPLLHGAGQREALQAIGREIDNVRLGWERAVERGDVDALLAAMDALSQFHDLMNRAQEGERSFGAAVEALREPANGDARARMALGRAMTHRGIFALRVGKLHEAAGLLEAGLSIARQVGDRHGAGMALNNLGILAGMRGDYERARELFRQSLALSQVTGELHRKAVVLNNLGILERMLGEHERARRLSLESLALYRQIGHRRGMAMAVQNLGLVAYYRGEFAEARRSYLESLSLCDEIGDRHGKAVALANLGETAHAMGEHEQARRFLMEALSIHREDGDRASVAGSLSALGSVAREMGDRKEARRHLQEALRVAVEVDLLPVAMEALTGLAALLADAGEGEKALEVLAFVTGHPATEKRTAEQARALAEEVAATLPSAAVAAAQERGRHRSLPEIMAEVGGW